MKCLWCGVETTKDYCSLECAMNLAEHARIENLLNEAHDAEEPEDWIDPLVQDEIRAWMQEPLKKEFS